MTPTWLRLQSLRLQAALLKRPLPPGNKQQCSFSFKHREQIQMAAESDEQHTVSWQSAAGALVALAANACLQDSGHVLGFSRDLAVFAHSSPVVCLVDGLLAVAQVLVQRSRAGDLARSTRDVAAHREQHYSRGEGEPSSPPPPPTPRKLVDLARSCMLLALCITQTTKLFALRSVGGTQVLGACYLLSYVVNAVLNTVGSWSGGGERRVDTDNDHHHHHHHTSGNNDDVREPISILPIVVDDLAPVHQDGGAAARAAA
ncbi:hypothetical protein F4778DRAFT_215267 [Xylariomycetidae sp. FL2044]|nr:hypothetical protein F4778DRAFT_215267 [Xylariomycetidae sp. FL2044]